MIMSYLESQIIPPCSSCDKQEAEKIKASYEKMMKEKDKELEKSKNTAEHFVEMYSEDLSKLKESFQKSIKEKGVYKEKISELNAKLTNTQLEREKVIDENTKLKKKLESIVKESRKIQKDLKSRNEELLETNNRTSTQVTYLSNENRILQKDMKKISMQFEKFKIENHITQQRLHASNIAYESRNYTLECERERLEEVLSKEYVNKLKAKEQAWQDRLENLSLQMEAMKSNEYDLMNVIDYQKDEMYEYENKLTESRDLKERMENEIEWITQENIELKKMVQNLNAEKLSLLECQNDFKNQIKQLETEDQEKMARSESSAGAWSVKSAEFMKQKREVDNNLREKEVCQILPNEDKQLQYAPKNKSEDLQYLEDLQNQLQSKLSNSKTRPETSCDNSGTMRNLAELEANESEFIGSVDQFSKSQVEFNAEIILAEKIFQADRNMTGNRNKNEFYKKDLNLYYSRWCKLSDEMSSLRLFCLDIVKKLWSANFRNTRYRHFIEKEVGKLKDSAVLKSNKMFPYQRKLRAEKVLDFTDRMARNLERQHEFKEIITEIEKRLDENFKTCYSFEESDEDSKCDSNKCAGDTSYLI